MTNFFKFEPSSSINCGVSAIATLPEEEDFAHSFKLKRKSELNKIIVNASNKPDYLAINIYFDTLRSWYSPKKIHRVDGTITHISKLKTKGIYLSNQKLADSYGCSTETIRKKLVKLEKLGLIQRSFQHRSNAVTNSYNQLIVYVWKITPHFFNEFGINRKEVSNLVPQTNHKYIAEKYNIDYNSQPQSDKDIKSRGGIHKIEGTKKLIELFSKEKTRSMRSNFNSVDLNDLAELNKNIEETKDIDTNRENYKHVSVANSSVVEKHKESQLEDTQYKTESTEYVESGTMHGGGAGTFVDTNSRVGRGASRNKTDLIFKRNPSRKPKTLDDFYPLTEEDCAELQSRSGRPFTKTAMNEILQSLANKAKQAIFWSKKGFLAYMTKVYEHELRDAVKTSSETFKIRSNIDSESMEIAKQEKYLSEIESCLQVNPEWHLKKKLASVLDRSRAYALLTSYKRIELGEGSDAGRCILHMQKQINLTPNEKEIILNQVRATHELVGEGGEYRLVETIELKYPEWKPELSAREKLKEKLDLGIKNNTESGYSPNNQDQGLWSKIRQIFIKTEGEYGAALDNHWISKLDVKIDEQAKKVELLAPSEFVKSYVEEKLLKSILYSMNQVGFELRSIEC